MTLRDRKHVGRSRRWLRTCTSVGDSPMLAGRPTIYGEGGQIRIGNRFFLASRPVASHLVAGPGARVHIGDDVEIGCGAAIAAYERIEIGNGTRIGPYVIIMDTNFHGSSGDQSVHHDCRPVTIEDGCRIGSRVTITRGVTIGSGAEILAGSVVSSAIPPDVCAAGARARIIGRAGDAASRWDSPAATLPELLMANLQLKSPPDLDDTLIPPDRWTDVAIEALLQAIEARLGLTLDPARCRKMRTFKELAIAAHKPFEKSGA